MSFKFKFSNIYILVNLFEAFKNINAYLMNMSRKIFRIYETIQIVELIMIKIFQMASMKQYFFLDILIQKNKKFNAYIFMHKNKIKYKNAIQM